MKQFLLRIPEDKYEALTKLATADNVSVNSEVNTILDNYLISMRAKQIVSLLNDVGVSTAVFESWYSSQNSDAFWPVAVHTILEIGASDNQLSENLLKLRRLIGSDTVLNASFNSMNAIVNQYIKKGTLEI